jgi:hypothetical protein
LSALLNYVRNSVAGNCEYSDNFDQQSIIVWRKVVCHGVTMASKFQDETKFSFWISDLKTMLWFFHTHTHTHPSQNVNSVEESIHTISYWIFLLSCWLPRGILLHAFHIILSIFTLKKKTLRPLAHKQTSKQASKQAKLWTGTRGGL